MKVQGKPHSGSWLRALSCWFVVFTKRALRAQTRDQIHTRTSTGKQLRQLWCMNPLNPPNCFMNAGETWSGRNQLHCSYAFPSAQHSKEELWGKNNIITTIKKARAYTGLSWLSKHTQLYRLQQHNRKQCHGYYWRAQANELVGAEQHQGALQKGTLTCKFISPHSSLFQIGGSVLFMPSHQTTGFSKAAFTFS